MQDIPVNLGEVKNRIKNAMNETASQNKLQFNSATSKAVLRRKGWDDYMPSVTNKRLLLVGLPIATNITWAYFTDHDLLRRGVPFHVCSYSEFEANWDTDTWKSSYDIVVLRGKYLASETSTPASIKAVLTAIMAATPIPYTIVHLGQSGNTKTGETSTFWDDVLGFTTANMGAVNLSNASYQLTGNEDILFDTSCTFAGWTQKLKDVSFTCLAHITADADHWIAAERTSDKKAYKIGYQGGTSLAENTAIDVGKLIWYIRSKKTHIAENRYYGKKYIAYGIDADRTNELDAMQRLLDVYDDMPLEIGLVTVRLDETAEEYFYNLQAKNPDIKIVSHGHSHYNIYPNRVGDTITAPRIPDQTEMIQGNEDLDAAGMVNDGIYYMTGTPTSETIQLSQNRGHLICGYSGAFFGRGGVTQLPFHTAHQEGYWGTGLKEKIKIPLFSVSIAADSELMDSKGVDAYTSWVEQFEINDTWDIPHIFYNHDLMLTTWYNWWASSGTKGYYDIVNGIDRRIKYFTDQNAYIKAKEAAGYILIWRSIATELLYDIQNCVSITSETISAGVNIQSKIASNRPIKGITVAIPTESDKTIATVKIEGVTVTENYEQSSDKKWVYVGLDLMAGKEHTILVTYA
jgi:hypothetical protein